MAMEDDTDSYLVRQVAFLGSERRILMQSANGPCPLLAVCNVLLLRNQLTLPFGERVGFQDLLQLLSNVLLDANATSGSGDVAKRSSEHAANIEQSLIGCIELLPTLNVGLDVNCRFCGPRDFEPTRELSVFDLLDISVVHGWVVSPQEEFTFAAVGAYSYNALVDRLIKFNELEARVELASVSSREQSDLLRDGPVISEFLESSANQMTYEGIIRLHSELHENELAVLYRNGHFSTLLKKDGVLYLLCTDVGFLDTGAVWERLDRLEGGTSFLGEDFVTPGARARLPRQAQPQSSAPPPSQVQPSAPLLPSAPAEAHMARYRESREAPNECCCVLQ